MRPREWLSTSSRSLLLDRELISCAISFSRVVATSICEEPLDCGPCSRKWIACGKCQLEREWVSHWMRLFSYLRRTFRPSDAPAGQTVPPQKAEERKAFAAKVGTGQ
jgi:hypothetical protein